MKRRVAELENGGGGSGGGMAGGEDGGTTRTITPRNAEWNSNHEGHHFPEDHQMNSNDAKKRGGTKRKTQSLDNVHHNGVDMTAVAEVIDAKSNNVKWKYQMVPSVVTPKHDSLRQRLANHLLLRDEMGCFSIELDDATSLFNFAEEEGTTKGAKSQSKTTSQKVSKQTTQSVDLTPNNRSSQVELEIEQEMRAYVKSILYQMIDAPAASESSAQSMSISGLAHVLLVKLNSLFVENTTTNHDAMEVDGGGDVTVVRNNVQQLMILVLKANELPQTTGKSSNTVTLTTNSWRAVFYLLNVLNDILVLSETARSDLRWWLYQARQSGSSSTINDVSGGEAKTSDSNELKSHPRIEGLSAMKLRQCWWEESDHKEATWTGNCQTDYVGDGWEPLTMSQPCNTFFELLVGLMKRNIVESSPATTCSYTELISPLEATKYLTQHVQMKTIDLVSVLMSDATPYNHAESNCGSKTPYLWKFWFNSLFPLYSATSNEAPVHSLEYALGDFLSLWEQKGGYSRSRLLGTGRRHFTQLLGNTVGGDAVSSKHGERGGSSIHGKHDKSKLGALSKEQRRYEQLSVDIKCRILQLVTHLMLSSSSVRQSMHHSVKNGDTEGVTLAKRALAVVLDEVDEVIVPFLSISSSDQQVLGIHRCLRLCHSSVQFLVALSRSDEGLQLLRLQTRLEMQLAGRSRWSSSAISCVTLALDGVLSRALQRENNETDMIQDSNLIPLLNSNVKQCILFFKRILSFVHSQHQLVSGHSKTTTTFLALISEQREVFLSCCQRILAIGSSPPTVTDAPKILRVGEELMYETRMLLEEVLIDDDEENFKD